MPRTAPPTVRGRVARYGLVAALILCSAGCSTPRVTVDPVYFPQAPATARVVHLKAFNSLQDIAPGLDSAKMGITLLASTITFTLIYVSWLVNRLGLQEIIDEAAKLKTQVITYLQD